jgi:nucleotide-binding universal stress UspA family protein
MTLEKILVPLDGSDLAEAALETAIELLNEQPAAMLVLLRAAEASRPLGSDRTEEQVRAVLEAESYLNGLVAGLREAGIGRVKTCVWYGPAATTIVEAAEVEKASLIVMSSHGRSGVGRLIFGSVAESVLHGTRKPILLVRDTSAPVLPPLGATTIRSTRDSSVVEASA